MRTFQCRCGARVFFDNTCCLACNSELGFLPDRGVLSALEPRDQNEFSAEGAAYRKCENYVDLGVCNWMVPSAERDEKEQPKYCQACALNNVIPNLSNEDNRRLWGEVEKAKRRLVYSLNRLGLALVPKTQDPEHGLAFDIKAQGNSTRVLTGHADGLITLNLAEADDVSREKMRVAMKERYRTLLGHFRHEVGHFYFERLIQTTSRLAEFRELFGDETVDYAAALKSHYDSGPPADWPDTYISTYASAHPWEDWAESFAHYLHMVDTLETAQNFGFTSQLPARQSLTSISDFELLKSEWTELTIALNALNRSMGLPDAYPFVISERVNQKLLFVHRAIREQRQTETTPSARSASVQNAPW